MTFPSKIFIDGGDPAETKAAKDALGFIDGQTTNPTLISKNPLVAQKISAGRKFSSSEAYEMYKKVVREISPIVTWSVSVETYSDKNTTADQMYQQAKEMYTWILNAWIKFPTTTEGLKAAERWVGEGGRANMTLVFSQSQAAAVYAATRGAKPGQVFVSPFVGRLDDRGENGMQLIENIGRMYEAGDGHVMVLTASLRHLNHHLFALKLKSDIITLPYKVFQAWQEKDFMIPDKNWSYDSGSLKPIPYQNLDLSKPWESFDIHHDLTDAGIVRFSADWNGMVG